MKHLKYLSYVIRHKWFVFLACCRYGIPLAGIVHDWSKCLPSEWRPYAENFYGSRKSVEALDAIGEFGCAELAPFGYFVGDRFQVAWNHHQKRNPHHWQYWLITMDSGETFPLPMPDRYRREMLADWIGAGRAITGQYETAAWYHKNREKMRLHSETRHWIEAELGEVTSAVPVTAR
jgi:hypothetical protein